MTKILNETIENLSQVQPQNASVRDKSSTISEILLKNPELQNVDKNHLIKIIERALKKRNEIRRNNDRIAEWRKEVFLDLEKSNPSSDSVAGRKRKSLGDDPCEKTIKKIINPIIDKLESIAAEEGVQNHQLLEQLVAHCNKRWGIVEKTSKLQTCSTEDATALIYNLDISINKYQELRLDLLKNNFNLPTRNEVDAHKKVFSPMILL